MSMKELDSGWTIKDGDICHFKQVDWEWASDELDRKADLLYAIETFDGALADEGQFVQQNTYLIPGYVNALLKAVLIQATPSSDDVFEIRVATKEEVGKWHALFDYYHDALFPPAISEQQVEELVSSHK